MKCRDIRKLSILRPISGERLIRIADEVVTIGRKMPKTRISFMTRMDMPLVVEVPEVGGSVTSESKPGYRAVDFYISAYLKSLRYKPAMVGPTLFRL
jgi:hypothetical protein